MRLHSIRALIIPAVWFLVVACAAPSPGAPSGGGEGVGLPGPGGSVAGGRRGRSGGPGATGRGRGAPPLSPAVEVRKYRFEETAELLEYAVFASSKVKRGTKAPLVIALHGRGVHPTSIMRFATGPAER